MIQERLAQRDFLGTIGHYDHPVLDSEIAQGLVSHLVSKLEIREDANGKPFLYGELEILDTPAGRILKAMYEGGANIYVSSRAAGKLRPVPGETFQEVDPLNYHFEGFDVIRRPGFLVAKPVYEEVPVQAPDKEAVHESAEPEQPKACESAEIQTLQSQVDKLAKILEKVVDDVYEEPAHTGDVYEEVQEQPIAKPQPDKVDVKKEEKGKEKQVSEAISDFISLMASTNISEEKFEEIIDIIAAAKKENK